VDGILPAAFPFPPGLPRRAVAAIILEKDADGGSKSQPRFVCSRGARVLRSCTPAGVMPCCGRRHRFRGRAVVSAAASVGKPMAA